MKRATLPDSIRVGYRDYAVRLMSPMEAESKAAYGECDNANAEIRVRADLHPVKQRNTVLHEALHACWYVAALDDDDKQERIVTTLANQLTQVWRDNPRLVAWLNEGLRP